MHRCISQRGENLSGSAGFHDPLPAPISLGKTQLKELKETGRRLEFHGRPVLARKPATRSKFEMVRLPAIVIVIPIVVPVPVTIAVPFVTFWIVPGVSFIPAAVPFGIQS